MTTPQVFTEVFPINTSKLPKLFGYTLDVHGDELNTIGGKLSYRLRKEFGGHWVWVKMVKRLVSEISKTEDDLKQILKRLWQQEVVFQNLHKVIPISDFEPTPIILANFVANGLAKNSAVIQEIKSYLKTHFKSVKDINITKVHDITDCVVQNHPCLSISIRSEVYHKDDLARFLSKNSPEKAVGLWVIDKNSDLHGEVTQLVGKLGDHRDRLLPLITNQKTAEITKNAPDNSDVVKVRGKYDYVAEALNISVRIADLHRYQTDSKKVLGFMRIKPSNRYVMVKQVATILSQKGWISNDPLTQQSDTNVFFTRKDILPVEHIRFGNNFDSLFDEKKILSNLKKYGLYKTNQNGRIIKVGLISTLLLQSAKENVSESPAYTFLTALQKEMKDLNFDLKSVGYSRLQTASRIEIEKAVYSLSEKNFDIILAILPDETVNLDDEENAYHHLKVLTVRDNYQSQVVTQSTVTQKDSKGQPKYKWAMGNIILGILAKTGNIPYILETQMNFTDLVVGIDIARRKKSRGVGSINATAIARIYLNSGEFLKYSIYDANLEGETIPKMILQSLFPLKEFQNKRVVIHRDGFFRGNEKADLQSWAEQIGATFYLVEVIKSGCPRIYRLTDNKLAQRPLKGSGFYLNEQEAILVSSLPPFEEATPNPLRIRTDGTLSIQNALQSVLALTLLHYGSLHSPRLPVTIHYSDKIAGMALDGIKPRTMEGTIPYWL